MTARSRKILVAIVLAAAFVIGALLFDVTRSSDDDMTSTSTIAAVSPPAREQSAQHDPDSHDDWDSPTPRDRLPAHATDAGNPSPPAKRELPPPTRRTLEELWWSMGGRRIDRPADITRAREPARLTPIPDDEAGALLAAVRRNAKRILRDAHMT